MHRIDTPTVQPDKFGQGKPGFTNGDPTTGTRATDLNSDFFDALQEELCTVIEQTGTRLNKHEHTQLYQAIQTCAENAANRKLSKKKNGKDILDKAQFIENLGLTETVELAKEAIPYHRKINGKTLTQDVQLTATDVNAVTPERLRLEVPVGVPLPWPTDRPPTGWLLCNGDRFNATQYPLLASAYPSGQLPDLRGEFIRGADAGRQVDTGRKVLSAQGDAIRNITGQFGYVRQGQWGPWVTATGAFYQTSTFSAAIKRGDPDNWGSVSAFDASRVVPTAHENRPRNVAFNYIVRGA
ncbi:MAG: hypothetical protein HamCj_10790 [Candidatus Hamiltonella defensa (Ceratovacuna japonica)]